MAIIQLPNRITTLVLLVALLHKGIKPLFAAPTLRIKEISALREKVGADYYFFPEKYDDIDYSSLAEELTHNTCYVFRSFRVGKESISPSFYHEGETNLLTDPPYIAFLTSSGSTGLPKVIPLTDEKLIQRCAKWKDYCGIDRHSHFLAYFSIMYPMTLHSPGVLTTLLCGGSVFLADRAETEIQSFLSLFDRYGITHSALVPSFAAEFVRLAGEKSCKFYSLKVLEIGREPLSDTLAEKIRGRFNCLLFEVYGMTEGSASRQPEVISRFLKMNFILI